MVEVAAAPKIIQIDCDASSSACLGASWDKQEVT
jgi:hypothetical protein